MRDQRTILNWVNNVFFFFVYELLESKVGLLYFIETQMIKDG